MKPLTICQPYAHLISLPDGHAEAKRVENRKWVTDYRGPLAIHAGKGRDYLDDGDLERYPDMAFSAVVAVANLVGCVRLQRIYSNPRFMSLPAWAVLQWPWLSTHRHVEGPVLLVLADVRRLTDPVACSGLLYLWDLPASVRAAIDAQLGSGVSEARKGVQ